MTTLARQTAPAFDLPDQSGQRHKLENYRGRWVVLYFYPKDDTPGCTREACSFRDANVGLRALGAQVLGVSADDEQSHAKFAGKYELNFPLLADDGARLARDYGAYGEKQMYGRTFEGVFRHTFLIDPEGRVAREWRSVKPDEHAAEVEEAIREEQAKRQ